LLKDTRFQLRYKSTVPSSVKFSVNEADLSTVVLPSTAGVWSTIDAGTFSASANSTQTVRLTVLSGTPDINYFFRVANAVTSIKNQLAHESQNTKSVQIYPNPYRQGMVNINLSGFEDTSDRMLTITNLMGQVVCQHKLDSNTGILLDLTGKLNEAVYVVSVESDNVKVFTKLIVR